MSRMLLSAFVVLAACHARAQPAPYAPPPPACVKINPVPVEVQLDAVARGTRLTLDVPQSIVVEIMRSGKDRAWYTIDCAAPDTVEHSTGFPDLDAFLATHLDDLAPDRTGCTTITAYLDVRDACEPMQTLD
jgi:hypothetical protein